MTKANAAKQQAIAAEMSRKYGAHPLPGKTQEEQRALYVGAVFTAILQGTNDCSSLRETAINGGC